MVRCPQCKVPMHAVTARANPGTLIQLDQCRQCGGIWCDKWELFPIDPNEAERLDAGLELDTSLLTSSVGARRRALYCPRCTAALERCQDPALPADLLFERCCRCDGIWLNRGQITRYKRHQRKIRMERMGREAMIRRIPKIYDDPKAWVVKGTRGIMAYPRMTDDPTADLDSDTSGVIGTILQALVRLVIGI
jgi:Zn-finger nucleic acid-binding protein